MDLMVCAKIKLPNGKVFGVFKSCEDESHWVLASSVMDVILESEVRCNNCKIIDEDGEGIVPLENALSILQKFKVSDSKVANTVTAINQAVRNATHI